MLFADLVWFCVKWVEGIGIKVFEEFVVCWWLDEKFYGMFVLVLLD